MGATQQRTSVLVTDGEQNAALAVVRSLGSAGHSVHVCASKPDSISSVSRYCVRSALLCDPLREPERYAREVLELTRQWGIDVVIPVSEASLLAILSQRAVFDRVTIPFPSLPTFMGVCDKQRVAALATAHDIHVPVQRVLADPAVSLDTSDTLRFPIVLKPTRSVVESANGRAKAGVVHVASREALRGAVDSLTPAAFPVLMQERIVGPGMGVFLLMWDGEVRAAFCHRRLREKPPSGGVSVLSESVRADDTLIARSADLLRALDWQGVAMVEYKMDAAHGDAYLMEINGRFWGSLQLAIDAGVDFPRLLVDTALGNPVAHDGSYRVGIRSRWLWGDADHLLARLRRSAEELALPPEAPGRARAIRDFFSGFVRTRDVMFRAADPKPALRETINWFRRR
jgi:predicted ATP-grasp superfamily ATP-dependent carboligase